MSIPPLPTGLDDIRVNHVANALHSSAIHLLRRVRAVDAESGLSPGRLSVLSVLCYAGPKTVGELAELEQVTPPAISRLLDGLERDSLARRERSQDDRRRVEVRATAKGKRCIEAARRRRLERIARELEKLNSEDLRVMRSASALLAELWSS